MGNRLRNLIFHLRGVLPLPIVVGMYFFGTPTRSLVLTGAAVALLGELIRVWAAGYIKRHRVDTKVDAKALVTNGPYAYVRNPLYIANFLIGIGFAIMSGWQLAVPLVLIAYVAIYGVVIVPLEEDFLRKEFTEAYDRYVDRVPRFFPSTKRYAEASGEFSFNVAVLTELHTFLLLVLLASFLSLKAAVTALSFSIVVAVIYLGYEVYSQAMHGRD